MSQIGIRVHKTLGYGLIDLEVGEHYSVVDSRINKDGILGPGSWESEKYTANAYLAWVNAQNEQREWPHRNNLEPIFLKDKDLTKWEWEPRQAFTLQAEYGLPILCVRPLWQQNWYRYDDTIDWAEETYCNGDDSQHNWFKVLPEGIFPYNGIYMRADTGEAFLGEDAMKKVIMWKRLWNYDYKTMKDHPENHLSPEKRDAVSEELLGMSWTEAEEKIVPDVPTEIKDLCEWGEAFTSHDTWKQLRPMIYVYWA